MRCKSKWKNEELDFAPEEVPDQLLRDALGRSHVRS